MAAKPPRRIADHMSEAEDRKPISKLTVAEKEELFSRTLDTPQARMMIFLSMGGPLTCSHAAWNRVCKDSDELWGGRVRDAIVKTDDPTPVPGWDIESKATISINDQAASIGFFTGWNCERCSNLMLAAKGVLTPYDDSYDVLVLYHMGHFPQVVVMSPEIAEDAPHRWSDGTLCLFDSRVPEWDPSMNIGDTIVPWAAEWLHLYELWTKTGNWYAPEAEE